MMGFKYRHRFWSPPVAIMLIVLGGLFLISGTGWASAMWFLGVIYGFAWRAWIASRP